MKLSEMTEAQVDEYYKRLEMLKAEAEVEARWRTAIHEAGHVITSMIFAPKKWNTTVILPNLGGLAYNCADFPEIQNAIIMAAGRAAEQLIKTCPVPATPQQAPSLGNPLGNAFNKLPKEFKETLAVDNAIGESDERRLALYAIAGHELKPEEWLPRLREVERQAAVLVRQYRPSILIVATELFKAGYLSCWDLCRLLPEGPQRDPKLF